MTVAIVLCTAPADEAPQLADRMLEAHLAACVNLLGPVQSRYRWQGKVEQAEETLLVIKTHADRLDELQARVSEWHSYDVPEFLVVHADSGLDAYLEWVAQSTDPGTA